MYNLEATIGGKHYWIRKYGNEFQVCQQATLFQPGKFKVVNTGSFSNCAMFLEEVKLNTHNTEEV